ncbi:response regulator with CheY-like receiver domain and winged-helix DNA-binding domain [Thermaerobacter subterraneus DSM 13965]|uniref:Stage 0 sporulation protein A homolog n=1 Tax=Thermaerobacter subterraneus DSM 13965 TaxID=867903 RepID=K6QF01_9FIRM|nr:response regulator with CheY-like receiver domain and winged-helix DNA-binding domain [Thermaerobacter subterraneus DSM 13965]
MFLRDERGRGEPAGPALDAGQARPPARRLPAGPPAPAAASTPTARPAPASAGGKPSALAPAAPAARPGPGPDGPAPAGPTVLVVDDEESLLELVAYNLQRNGMAPVLARDGAEALRRLEERRPQVIILDVMLPDTDGFTLCRHLRERGIQTPILMLTARDSEIDKVLGLELGADDYVTKPFSPRELVARIKALLRRTEGRRQQIGPIVIDYAGHEVYRDGQRVALTPTEFKLLATLAAEPGRAFTRQELLDRVWGEEAFGDPRTVDVHVRHLREKLERNPSQPEWILTVRGHGYKLNSPVAGL